MAKEKNWREVEKQGIQDVALPFDVRGMMKGLIKKGVVTISKRTDKTYKGVPVTEYKEGVSGGQSVAKQAEDIIHYDKLKKAEAYLSKNPKEAKRLGLQIPKPDK